MALFISHATIDGGSYAKALAEALKSHGRECWYAPRDVRPGKHYPDEIIEALQKAEGVILLLTPLANRSTPVLQEIEAAVAWRKVIAPVVLNGTEPVGGLRLFVGVPHRIPWTGSEAVARALLTTFDERPQEVRSEAPATKSDKFRRVREVTNLRRQRASSE